jgi:hypothetical protein
MTRLWCLFALTPKTAEGIAVFLQYEEVSEWVVLGRAHDGENLETGPQRRRIGSHCGGDRFICGGRFAANDGLLPV